MKLENYKLVFITAGLVGILLIALPIFGSISNSHTGEQFSELFLLDQEHMAENYPSNLEKGREYLVYVVVGNHMASSAYYVLQVKLGNQTDLLPNSTSATSSPLEPLFEYKFFVADNETWEAPLAFSISEVSFVNDYAVISKIFINEIEFEVNKEIEWNEESAGFYFKVFVELWIFNPQVNSIQFHNRFVSLKLSLTKTD